MRSPEWLATQNVSLNRTVKRLRREIGSDPKKAALLGVMGLVAVYFWLPLAWGWIKPNAPGGMPANAVPSAQNDTTNTPAALTNQEAKTPQYTWRQVSEWTRADAKKRPLAPRRQQRDPFIANEIRGEEDNKALAKGPLTPADLGMVLSATIVGSRPIAHINGKKYQQGDTIKVTVDGKQMAFTLVEVRLRNVVLERNGEQFELNGPKAKSKPSQLAGQVEQ